MMMKDDDGGGDGYLFGWCRTDADVGIGISTTIVYWHPPISDISHNINNIILGGAILSRVLCYPR